MSKNKKILSSLALVAGVTALGGVAQADEVQANKEVTENTTTEVNQVTAEQVAQASETASVAQNNVASQSATVSAATSEVASQKALVSELSSQASELSQVTDEDIANAKTSANNAASQVTATSQTAQSTATVESTAQANVDSQSAVVVADQAQVDATQSAVEQAQANVNTLNNPTDTTDLQNQVDTLKTAVSNDGKAVKTAEETLVNVETAQSNKDKAVKDQEAVVSKASDQVNSTKSALDTAKAETEKATSGVSGAQAKLDKAQEGTQTTVTGGEKTYSATNLDYGFAYTDAYISAIKALADGTGTATGVRKAINAPYETDTVSAANLLAANQAGTYVTSAGVEKVVGVEDTDKTVYNVAQLPEAQRIELTQYALGLINPLRTLVGSKELKVGETSLKLSNTLANYEEYYRDGKNLSDINTVTYAKSFSSNLSSAEADTGSQAVIADGLTTQINLNGANSPLQATGTMSELKQAVYQSLVSALFGCNTEVYSSYQGALNVLGLNNTADTFGLDFALATSGGVSIVPYLDVVLTNSGSTTKTVTTYDEEAIAQAKADFEAAKANLTKAQSVQSQAKTDYDNAVTTYNTAVSTLNDIKNQVVDVATAKANVTSAKQQLANDQSALTTAQKALDTANASAQEKAKALATAQANLAKAQLDYQAAKNTLASDSAKLTQLQGILTTAQAENEKAQTAYAAALTNLKTANALVDKLTNAQTELPKVQDKLAKAQETLEKLQSILDDETATLEALKETATEAQSDYEALLALYNAQNAQKQQDDIKANGGDPVVTTDDKGNVTGYVDGKVNHTTSKVQNTTNAGITAQTITAAYNKAVTKSVTQAVTAKRATQSSAATYQATLPTTGDSETALYSLMGMLTLGLASVGLRKRRF